MDGVQAYSNEGNVDGDGLITGERRIECHAKTLSREEIQHPTAPGLKEFVAGFRTH